MSFDLMATLFGGVTALIPIFARDILDIGPVGRRHPALIARHRALMTAAVLTRFPVQRNGRRFPLCRVRALRLGVTRLFGLSTNVALSIASLLLLGAGDMVSSVVRQTIVYTTTPDPMRGRVAGVNSFFIGCSGQLGSFRAGVMAAMIGAVGQSWWAVVRCLPLSHCGSGCSRRCATWTGRTRRSRFKKIEPCSP
jgi:MFS family permease